MPMHIYCWVRNVEKGKNKGLENSAFECCQWKRFKSWVTTDLYDNNEPSYVISLIVSWQISFCNFKGVGEGKKFGLAVKD